MHTCLPQGTPPYSTSVKDQGPYSRSGQPVLKQAASSTQDQLQLTSNAVVVQGTHTVHTLILRRAPVTSQA